MIKVGDYNEFLVMRKTDIGYMLMHKDEEILLHYKQTLDKELELNTQISAFVQLDSKGRMIATLERPLATVNEYGFASVSESILSLGVFLNIGTVKDVLLSKDYLPRDVSLWPQMGEKLLIKLIYKNNHLNALLATKEELSSRYDLKEYPVGTILKAHVIRSSNLAINAATEDKNYVFISTKQFRHKYHLGQEVSIMVIGYHDDEIVASLNKVAKEQVEEDNQIILDYLIRHNGKMPYTAKTSSEELEKVFHMSRKSFKRALGALYKEKKVICSDYETTLNKE